MENATASSGPPYSVNVVMGGVSADEFKKLKNRMAALEDSNKKLISSNSSIKAKNDLLVKLAKEIVDENAALRKETNFLRSKLNCNNYHTDSVEQYGRKESPDVIQVDEIEMKLRTKWYKQSSIVPIMVFLKVSIIRT